MESNIFSRFGLTIEIIMDKGVTFISGNFTQFINKFGVNHFTSSSYYLQENRQVESTNKNMVIFLKNIINDRSRQWHTILTYTLWAEQTTTKTSIGHTPFNLLYVQEAIIPMELELTSLRLAL